MNPSDWRTADADLTARSSAAVEERSTSSPALNTILRKQKFLHQDDCDRVHRIPSEELLTYNQLRVNQWFQCFADWCTITTKLNTLCFRDVHAHIKSTNHVLCSNMILHNIWKYGYLKMNLDASHTEWHIYDNKRWSNTATEMTKCVTLEHKTSHKGQFF